jgi:hypothetical protein
MEDSLKELRDLHAAAQASPDSGLFNDWMHDKSDEYGLWPQLSLVVHANIDPAKVARNTDVASTLSAMIGSSIGTAAAQVIQDNKDSLSRDKQRKLAKCVEALDLFRNDLPYPFPSGEMMELRSMNERQRGRIPGFIAENMVPIAKQSKTVARREQGVLLETAGERHEDVQDTGKLHVMVFKEKGSKKHEYVCPMDQIIACLRDGGII